MDSFKGQEIAQLPSCLGNSLEYLQNIWEMYDKGYQNHFFTQKVIREAALVDKNSSFLECSVSYSLEGYPEF